MTKHEVVKVALSVQKILEWAFYNEGAQLELPEEFEAMLGRGYGRGTWATFAELEALGCRPDGGGRSDCHEDAEVVAAIVSNLSDMCGGKMMAIRVSEIARQRVTPDWMPGARPKIVPVERRGDGAAKTEVFGYETVSFKKTDKKGRTRTRYRREERRGCPVIESPTFHQIRRARDFYAEWWFALSDIRRNLQASQMLRRHSVTDAMPDKEPWRNEPPIFRIEGLGPFGWYPSLTTPRY